jgi:hypothetical protein
VAYARNLKRRAMELWAAGDKAVEQIAAEVGVNPRTLDRWRYKKQPEDWDAFAQRIADDSAREAQKRLVRERANLGLTHFKDMELARNFWRRTLYEEDEFGTLRPRVLSTKEVRDIMAAYRDLQTCQRAVFGEAAYVVGVQSQKAKAETGIPSDIPLELVHQFEDALAKATADPGSLDGSGVEDGDEE